MSLDPHNEDDVLLELYCAQCDNVNCKEQLGYVYCDSQKGCNRWVKEEDKDRYIHYMLEDIPFWNLQSKKYVDKDYKEVLQFLNSRIYNCPIASKRDEKGYKIGA